MERLKVLVVAGSAPLRLALAGLLNREPDLKAVSVGPFAPEATGRWDAMQPDLLILGPGAPRGGCGDGQAAVAGVPVLLMADEERAPRPGVRAGGAFLLEPGARLMERLMAHRDEVVLRVREAALNGRRRPVLPGVPQAGPAVVADRYPGAMVFVGASTGGTEALLELLSGLPADAPPVMVTQHMPANFVQSFARRLDGACQVRVREAADGERVQPGNVYVSPGHSHMLVRRAGGLSFVQLSAEAPVNRHRPSVDVLFNSAAERVGAAALGVILTGMGKDGAAGLLAMRKAGAYTVAQDEATCVVFGMPREAIALGAAHEVAPLSAIASRVMARLAVMGPRPKPE